MFSKSLIWIRRNVKSARFAAILSFVALIVAFGVVQANGPMRPQPPRHPGGMGMWGQVRRVWYPMEPVPKMTILAVVKDGNVTFETSDYPANEDFTVTMGYMYTRGVNGIKVGTFNSGDDGIVQETFDIPEDLYGQYKISIRATTDHTYPYYSYNWFYNNTTDPVAEPVEPVEAVAPETEAPAETEEAAVPETEAPAETEEAEASETEEVALELTGQAWQLVEFSDPVEGVHTIDAPENYQVEFLPEGGMNIQADCNMGTGSYTAEAGSLTVTVESMTLAQCQEGSYGDDFVNHLSASATYSIEAGNLSIELAAEGGTLTFRTADIEEAAGEAGTGGAEEAPAAEEAAETEEAPAAEEAAETEEAPAAEEAAETEEAPAAEEAAEAEEAPAAEEAAEAEEAPAETTGLVGGVWQWAEFSDAVEGVTVVENPEIYTAEFLTDGSVNVQADCNSGRGNYTVDGSNITISDLAMTRALCEPESLSDDFVNYLTAAAIYFFEDVNLYLDLPADSGTMKFVPAESEETAAVTRSAAMKASSAAQDDTASAEAETEDGYPSFKICTVEKNETVLVVTAEFPEDMVFNVKMGPILVAKPMKPSYGPMPPPSHMPAPRPPTWHPPGPDGQPQQSPQGQGAPVGSQPAMVQPVMNQNAMGQMDMNMAMGQSGMNPMWGKQMGPKVYVPFYYEAGTLETGEGGNMEAKFEIPSELAGYYRIQIMMRTDDTYPHYAYNWFYNNDAAVCNGEVDD